MNCKFCQGELESNSSVCPHCHKDNLKDSLKWLKVTALVLVCLVLLVVLAGLICYGVTGSFVPEWLITEKESHQLMTPDGLKEVDDKEMAAAMDKVVMTMGEHKLTNRELQLYYWISAYNNTGKADLTKDLTTQIYDEKTGQSYHDYFLDEALKSWKEITMMCDAAAAADFKLPEEYQEYLDDMKAELEYYVEVYVTYYGYNMSGVDDLIALQFGPGADFETYYDYTYDYYYGSVYWSELVENMEVSEEDIENFFEENEESLAKDYDIPVTKDFGDLIDIRTILIEAVVVESENKDGEKINYKDWEATLKEAQKVYDEWQAGEATEETFIELVKKYSKDDSVSNDGLYTDLYNGSMGYVDVRHILIFPEGATSQTVTSKEWPESAWTYAKNKAEEILNEWVAGEKTEASFGALANKHSQDQDGKVTNGGLIEDVAVGQMVENFEDWCFDPARQTGDTGIVKTEYGYHVMYYVRTDREAEEWCFADGRQAGDVGICKTDDGYMLIYFVEAEPAWHRYSYFGAQAQKAQDQLDGMIESNPGEISKDQVVIGMLEEPELSAETAAK